VSDVVVHGQSLIDPGDLMLTDKCVPPTPDSVLSERNASDANKAGNSGGPSSPVSTSVPDIDSGELLFIDPSMLPNVLQTLPLYSIPEPSDEDAYPDDLSYGQLVPLSRLLSLEPPPRDPTAKTSMSRRLVDRIRPGMPNFVSRSRYTSNACGK
jgi:hypothetical protein